MRKLPVELKSIRGKFRLRRVLRILFFLLLLGFVCLAFLPVNLTRSMPRGVYLRLPAVNLAVGDIVQADNPSPGLMGVTAQNLLKRIAAVTEDGKYYLAGDSELSFDSRYFGFVGKDGIRAKLIPVFVE